MADISQIKLPNGDIFNLVDETSGYKKFHMVEASIPIMGGAPTMNTSYSQILSWIEAGEEVIIVNTSLNDNRYYYWGKSNTTLLFMSLWGEELDIDTDNIRHFEPPWLTLDTLPIYDGTVE